MAELVFIGTGDAFGSGGRRNSAILVRDRGKTLLLDCGPTTHVGLHQLGVDPREIDAIALSHFHGDHCAGVPLLLLDYLYERERETPLRIIGPSGVEAHVDALTQQFYFRSEHERRYALEFEEWTPEREQVIDGFTLTALPAFHHPDTHPHMIRVHTGDREIVFSGDTGWFEKLPDYVGHADLFICECVFFEGGFEYHLSHERLALERTRFQAARTLLTHLGSDVLDNLDRVQFDTARDGLILPI